jgi:hypothetical protein
MIKKSVKQVKIKKPIMKLPIMDNEEGETKEATGSGSAGGFSGPAFSMWSEDETAKSEYKKSKPVEGEFTEATGSGSVGSYDAPGFQDVNMKGNTLKGKGRSWKKSQIPGGSFVEIDKKCKTFPYCSQGNSKDKPVKLRKSSPINEAIYNVSLKTGLSIDEIKKIILSKMDSIL